MVCFDSLYLHHLPDQTMILWKFSETMFVEPTWEIAPWITVTLCHSPCPNCLGKKGLGQFWSKSKNLGPARSNYIHFIHVWWDRFTEFGSWERKSHGILLCMLPAACSSWLPATELCCEVCEPLFMPILWTWRHAFQTPVHPGDHQICSRMTWLEIGRIA